MLAWYVGLLALAVTASIVGARQVLINQVNDKIEAEFVEEVGELHYLAKGNDPATGKPFAGDVARLFRTDISQDIQNPNEVKLAFVGGRPLIHSPGPTPYRLDHDAELTTRWKDLRRRERGHAQTPAGRVDYLAVPVQSNTSVPGVFVIAIFSDREKAEINAAVRAAAGVGLVVLLLGALVGWRLADRVLVPVRLLTKTARAITESNLQRRIPSHGQDEVAQLAVTFNSMLDRLERAFATQRQFLDDAGHELRTPITIIRGHLELLGDDPKERRETLALVMDELDRTRRIVDDLLALAKAEQPDFLNLDTVDVEPLTLSVFEKAAALAERDWQLESTGHGKIVADRQRLTQALIQLAQNAANHTQKNGQVAIGSSTRNGEARFWVRDQGVGIDPAEQQRIFERFSGASRSEGAGLGLSIVKAIAQAHHGRVELVSRLGAGATFTLVIPTDQPPPVGEEKHG
jgi:signal transduction histidine kinase